MIPRTRVSLSYKQVLLLTLVFLSYVLLGGVAFWLFEAPLEHEYVREAALLHKDFRHFVEDLDNHNLTVLIARVQEVHGVDLCGDDGAEEDFRWSFYNSFFFSITVVTTIGYGHLSPSTANGRAFCVLYALVGIPLTGILLAAIGDLFSRRLMRIRNKAPDKLALASRILLYLTPWFAFFMLLPAFVFHYIEGWTYLESLYYCFISLSTIGFGDFVAGTYNGKFFWLYKTWIVIWIIFGLGYLAMLLNFISRGMRSKQVRMRMTSGRTYVAQRFFHRLDELSNLVQQITAKASKKSKDNGAGSLSEPSTPTVVNGNLPRILELVDSLKKDIPHVPAMRRTPSRRHSLPDLLLPHPREEGEASRDRTHSVVVDLGALSSV